MMPRRKSLSALVFALFALPSALVSLHSAHAAKPTNAANLPLPSSMGVTEYEAELFPFLNERRYKQLGWAKDKTVRDTGPYIDGTYFGTHPAVRIYYSPEIIAWLKDGMRTKIPDGAMMIKEQYEPPAARWQELDDEKLFERLSSWTVMVKDAAGSHDGWFWSNPAKNQQAASNHYYPFDHPVSGFGIYCVRCHASTKTTGETNEYTFASLRNVEGYPGEPLEFPVDDSWRAQEHVEEPAEDAAVEDTTNEALVEKIAETGAPIDPDASHPRCTGALHPEQCQPTLNDGFLKLFSSIKTRGRNDVAHIPPVTHDWVVRRPAEQQAKQPFVTSNQCMSCHAGLMAPFGPTMYHATTENKEYSAPGVHLSPYGEWRWTPMGLAGRDPIFFAQLESEVELMRRDYADDPRKSDEMVAELTDACLNCHGAMGKRQHDIDHPGERFSVADVMRESTDPHAVGDQHWQYGALARDGISCTVCHHMQSREQPADDERPYLQFYLETSITGNIHLGPANELHGPFEDKEISPYVMEHAMGYKPTHNDYIKSSRMCGSCHVVNLPIVDWKQGPNDAGPELIAAERRSAFKGFHHHVEQATYLEWLNSAYENEFNADNPEAKTCQDCHMKRDYHNDRLNVHLDRIQTRMAAVQDSSYPEAENTADEKELEIRERTEGYARHNFRGLNVFLLEMFNQFDDVLGVRKYDFMTGSTEDIPHAVDDFVRQAKSETAEIAVDARVADGELVASVEVTNKAGHRFPSGVGFRRAFLEFLVIERAARSGDKDRIVWSSGRTNELGVLVDDAGAPLPCEFFADDPSTDKQAFQPHHEVISSPQHVQIYETLLWSTQHRFTTSFIHGCEVVKDNRLLPRGWRAEGPDPALTGEFLRATYPCPTTLKDPRYANGSGTDEITYRVKLPPTVDTSRVTVQATLFYQAIPPYFLKSLFELAPDGPATQRLHYICSNIDLKGTAIEDWKLPVVSAQYDVK
jgi:hypothetical protein